VAFPPKTDAGGLQEFRSWAGVFRDPMMAFLSKGAFFCGAGLAGGPAPKKVFRRGAKIEVPYRNKSMANNRCRGPGLTSRSRIFFQFGGSRKFWSGPSTGAAWVANRGPVGEGLHVVRYRQSAGRASYKIKVKKKTRRIPQKLSSANGLTWGLRYCMDRGGLWPGETDWCGVRP